LILVLIAVAAFLVGFFGYLLATRGRRSFPEEILDAIIDNFLTRSFTAGELAKVLGMPREEVERALKRLARGGLLSKSRNRYRLIVPLFFLSHRQYQKALRLTANDEILYGGAQQPFLSNLALLLIYALIPASLIFSIIVLLGVFPQLNLALADLFGYLDVRVFLLFTVVASIVVVDAAENLVKSWAQERFSVVVGAQSGIYYDERYATELSGRIPRGKIREVSYRVNLLQKLLNLFAEIPHGDIIVKVKGRKNPVVFRNMPFPRELFYVIRRVQLKGLGWRKRHARTLMMWRTRSMIPAAVRA